MSLSSSGYPLPSPPTVEALQLAWREVQKKIHEEFGDTSSAWVDTLALVGYDAGKVILGAPTRFARDWVRVNGQKSLLGAWRTVMAHVFDIEILIGRRSGIEIRGQHFENQVTIDFALAEGRQTSITLQDARGTLGEHGEVFGAPLPQPANQVRVRGETEARSGASEGQAIDFLNSWYTFENFVVGESNTMAYMAARRLAEGGGSFTFNPLCICGGAGLGKTHLMHGIAHYLKTHFPAKKVLYLSAEQFMFRFVDALRNRETQSFKHELRSVDLLLVDDFQFIAGKESTQDEFFHTFNALLENKKQIVISADRMPQDLEDVGERIRSRLSSGLIVDVGAADYALRLGILEIKSNLLKQEYPHVRIPQGMMDFLAREVTSNVRELEGALNRLIAHAAFAGRPLSPEMVETVIGDLLRHSGSKNCTADEILTKVAQHYAVGLDDLQSAKRLRTVVIPRQVAMALCKQLTDLSLVDIGKKFGGRDHSTVMHAIRKVEEMQQDEAFSSTFKALKRLFV